MARTRAQLAAQEGRVSGGRPQGIQKRGNLDRTARLRRRPTSQRTECDQEHPSLNKSLKAPSTFDNRGAKRPADGLVRDLEPLQKRRRPSPRLPLMSNASDGRGSDQRATYEPTDPIEFWARERQWPREYFELDMEHLLARRKSLSSLVRKRSNSATSTTPSDQKPREEKSAPYRDPRYKTLLATKGSFMGESDLGITEESKDTCNTLLGSDQTTSDNTLFQDHLFKQTCRRVEDKDEARVIRDIAPLIVPSAEILCTFGAKHLDILTESVNEGWSNSIPLTGTRPQPDYSLGFAREAFTSDQLEKLSPFLGNFIAGDQSFFMATYSMYFPFLTCEVKCGTAALDVADRQNAHSMTLAVRAVAELFRAVKREGEIHRQILAFSISHDHRSVRIYGHYPVVDGKETKYYRHPIRTFDFTELDGKEKWTAYRFTKNIYDIWMPTHFKMICSAIDQLPSDLALDDPSLPATGLSQELESQHLSQSDADSASLPAEPDSQSSKARPERVTPGTSFTDPRTTKRRKGRKLSK